MMRIFISFSLLFLSLNFTVAQEVVDSIETPVIDEPIYKKVEQMPRFYSGRCERFTGIKAEQCAQIAILEFINENQTYPDYARENNIEGFVVVRFIVEKDGSTTNVKIVRSVEEGIDAEAILLVKSMPKWIPGKHRGKKVKVEYNLPIKFKL